MHLIGLLSVWGAENQSHVDCRHYKKKIRLHLISTGQIMSGTKTCQHGVSIQLSLQSESIYILSVDLMSKFLSNIWNLTATTGKEDSDGILALIGLFYYCLLQITCESAVTLGRPAPPCQPDSWAPARSSQGHQCGFPCHRVLLTLRKGNTPRKCTCCAVRTAQWTQFSEHNNNPNVYCMKTILSLAWLRLLGSKCEWDKQTIAQKTSGKKQP